MAKTVNSICFTTLLLAVLLISTEIPKSEANCDKYLGEAPVYPCKEKACKAACEEHYHYSCKGECEKHHGYDEKHCHCYGKY